MTALLTGGCGGQGTAESPLVQRGRTVFAGNCSGCHTLTGRDSRVTGGDLAMAALSARDVASFVRVMPVRLQAPDIAAVAAYVHAIAVERAR